MLGLVKMAVALLCATAVAGPAASEGPAGGHLSSGERVATIGGLTWPDGREFTAVAGDGDVYVAAEPRRVSPSRAVQVRRYLPDGGLDSTFGAGGVVVIGDLAGEPFHLGELLVDAYGLPYLVGTNGPGETAVVRLTTDGSVDSTYGEDGIAALDLGRVTSNGPLATIDQQRRVILAAERLARLTPNGDLDASFGTGGSVPIPGGRAEGIGVDIEGGVQLTLPDAARDGHAFRLMGLDPRGHPDRSLGPEGVRTYKSIGAARSLTVTPYGTAVVLGTDESRRPGGVAEAEVLQVGSGDGHEVHRRVFVPLPHEGTAEGTFDDPDGFVYLIGHRFVVVVDEGESYGGFPYSGKLIVSRAGEIILRGLSITDGDRKVLIDGIVRDQDRRGLAHAFFATYPAARYEVTYAPESAGGP